MALPSREADGTHWDSGSHEALKETQHCPLRELLSLAPGNAVDTLGTGDDILTVSCLLCLVGGTAGKRGREA